MFTNATRRMFVVPVVMTLLTVTALLLPASQAQEAGSEAIVLTQRGNAFSMANGLFFDDQDRLYIASVAGREIIVMDPDNGEILDRIGPERGVSNPDDVTIGPDGSIYWTDFITGTVGRLAPDGEVTKQFVGRGVNPIAFNAEGRLFVALDFQGDALYELDPDLTEEPRLITEGLGSFNAFQFGENGFLWGPLFSKGKIAMVVPGSGKINEIFVEGGFVVPVAVKFNSKGELHVLDMITGEVARVDPLLGTKTVIGRARLGSDNLAFDSQDRLFVSNNADGSIIEILPNGTNRVVVPGGLIAPQGVAVLPNPDGGEVVFIGEIQSLRGLGGASGDELLFHYRATTGISAQTLFADGPDRLILSSWFTNSVQIVDPFAGEVLEQFNDFAIPLNAIRFQGDLIVAELVGPGQARVTRASGDNPAERTTLAGAAQNIFVPTGLAATEDDLWVADFATGTVWQLIADGETLDQPRPVAGELAGPEGLTAAPDGSLLVVESKAGRLSQIDPETGTVTVIAEDLALGAPGPEGLPPTWLFNGVAVGSSGVVYVTGDQGRVLYRVVLPLF